MAKLDFQRAHRQFQRLVAFAQLFHLRRDRIVFGWRILGFFYFVCLYRNGPAGRRCFGDLSNNLEASHRISVLALRWLFWGRSLLSWLLLFLLLLDALSPWQVEYDSRWFPGNRLDGVRAHLWWGICLLLSFKRFYFWRRFCLRLRVVEEGRGAAFYQFFLEMGYLRFQVLAVPPAGVLEILDYLS